MQPSRNPYPALFIAALLPALLLTGIWKFAEGRQPPLVAVAPSDGSPSVGARVLPTPLLSVRRAPSILSAATNKGVLEESLQPLLELIDDTSCVAVSVNGAPVAAKNETMPLRPASNVKLLTAAVALEVLGEDYQYQTMVQGDVDASGHVLGDLFLVGGGDPVLANWWWNGPNPQYPPFNMTIIEGLADAVKAAGVTAVDGRVVGDASKYDDEWYLPSWTNDVKFVEGGPISALLVNDSRESLTKSSVDPSVGAATVFTQLLIDRGITVAKEPRAGASISTTTIASVRSNPLPLIIAEMLTTSDNNTAEMVLREIGYAKGGSGSTQAGLNVVNDTLAEWGIPLGGVELLDGSGLSDDNRLTCASLLSLLQRESVDGPLGRGLAVGGAAGGTLSDAFGEGNPLAGIVRAKTGTLYNYQDGVGGRPGAKTLSGYVPLEGGGQIEFAMLLNGPQIAEQTNYRPIWDLFASIMGSYLALPSPDDLAPG